MPPGPGTKVTGAASRPLPGDTDAPDEGELITKGAFIAFYSSEEKADRLYAGILRNAMRLKAGTSRRGRITVLYLPGSPRAQIDRCVGYSEHERIVRHRLRPATR